MVDENRIEYGYHLFAHYHDHDDVMFVAEFFEVNNVYPLEKRIKDLLNKGYDEDEIYVIYGQGKSFTTTKEVVADIRLLSDSD